jgi:hypothetical protein
MAQNAQSSQRKERHRLFKTFFAEFWERLFAKTTDRALTPLTRSVCNSAYLPADILNL